MAVILVGVTLVTLMAYLLSEQFIPSDVMQSVAALAAADPAQVGTATQAVLETFRRSVLTAVAVAGLGALLVGGLTSWWLARQILRPLQQIAHSSRRIAWGHYDERVPVPDSNELAAMATNFNQMAEALQQVDQQRVALIGNVSHELRTPLTGLEGYLEGLMDGLFPGNEETYAPMYAEVRRMRRLVNDLQALSRVESGNISLHLRDFDAVALAERAVAQVQPQAEAGCLQVETAVAPPELLVHADPDRAAQALLNLLSNAIRYTPQGGCITVRITADERMAQIAVIDDGVGIPADSLPYLFERFYRVDASRARASGGSGIGLTISRHLAWAMGGDITAASAGPGRGSTFTLTLPLA
jgi:histidine kinase